MNRTPIIIGILLIGMSITVHSLGYSKLVGDVGSGTVTIYPAAAMALLGALTLLTEVKRIFST